MVHCPLAPFFPVNVVSYSPVFCSFPLLRETVSRILAPYWESYFVDHTSLRIQVLSSGSRGSFGWTSFLLAGVTL